MMMKNTENILMEVDLDNDEYHLILLDESKWFVNPSDLPTVATWLPTTELTLSDNESSMFNCDITNTVEDITISARRVK